MENDPASPPRVALETTDQSLLHFLAYKFLQNKRRDAPSVLKTALWTGVITCLPLLIVAILSGHDIMTWQWPSQPVTTPVEASQRIEKGFPAKENYVLVIVGKASEIGPLAAKYGTMATPPAPQTPVCLQPTTGATGCTPPQIRLPLPHDWNVIFMFMVSFPVLASLTVRDQCVLVSSIERIRADGVLTLPDGEWNRLCSWWRDSFRLLNVLFQLCGLITGAAIVWINYAIYVQRDVGYWIAPTGSLLPVGYLYFFCIFLFYFVTSIYILRNIAISFYLSDLVAHSKVSLLPLHPDRSGGLRPIGEVGLRNQYALTVVGLNVVILWYISVWYFPDLHHLTTLIRFAIGAYVLISPMLFFGPLLPFRAAMLNTRTTLMNEVSRRLRIEIDAVLQQLGEGKITKQDEDMVDRLSTLGTFLDQLPVWPFDLRTIQKFLTAYITPAVGAILLELGKKWFV